uniref:RING-type domain-containing protein n=1 Tax=Sinocyclocheilus grahami TaxID=75366 RepID=A0A672QAM5_SINGR
MAHRASFSEYLNCPVCFELFTNPVVLECSHSFCQTFIDKCWIGQFRRICPVCRMPCLSERPPASLVLRNIVENFRARQQSSVEETEQCKEERQERESTQTPEERCRALCTVCQRSRRHNDHPIIPLEEAAQELKVFDYNCKYNKVHPPKNGLATSMSGREQEKKKDVNREKNR